MKNFFDDVFDNKFLFEKEELLKSFNEKLEDKKEEKLFESDLSDKVLEDMMADFRANPERAFTKKESRIIKEKMLQARQEGEKLLGVIKDRKEFINNKLKSSEDNFTLNT